MNMKKILSVVLCFVMLLSLPGMAFAVDEALSSGDASTSENTGEGSNASTSDNANDSSNTSVDQDTTSDGEKESVSGSDNVGGGDHSDATNGTTIVEPEIPKADAPGTDDAKEDKGDADQDSDVIKGDANQSDDGKNDTNHEDSDQEDAAQEEDKKDDTSKDEIADEEDAVDQEEEAGEEAPEITYPAVEETIEDEDSGINVVVNAPEGAFPEGTTVSILPIHQLAGEEAVSEETEIPAAITNILGDINEKTGDELVQELTEAIQQSVAEAMSEEPVELQQMVAFDITFTCEGKEVQPVAGYKVDVKFEVANESDLVDMEAPDQQLQVFHVETDDKGETKANPVEAVEVDSKADVQNVSVEAESFSIYVVAGLYQSRGELVKDGQTITMIVGEEKVLYSDKKGDNNQWSETNTSADNKDTISIASHGNWVTVQAKKVGTIQLQYGHWMRGYDTVTIEVVATGAQTVAIQNKIVENGCFIPVLKGYENTDVITYQWYRSTSSDNGYEEVTGTAVDPQYAVNNGVNVAVDGGAQMYYKVKAFDAQGTLLAESGPERVPYFDAIQNGSFEMPITSLVEFSYHWGGYSDIIQIPNGYKDLYWQTTGSDGKIEIVRNGSTSNKFFGVNKAAHKEQFAELNCEAAGTLYQDVLTAPGAELYWSLSHRARIPGSTPPNDMYVVIMPTKVAVDSEIKTTDDVIQLIGDQYEAIAPNTQVEGSRVAGTDIFVWKISSDEKQWYNYLGAYQAVSGQYLTRFFFVSAKGDKDGNLLDNISFSTDVPYTVEYYVDGKLQDGKTESGTTDPYKKISASHLNDFTDYALDHIQRGDTSEMVGDPASMLIDPGKSNVFKLYYVSSGISVTKKVTLPAGADLNTLLNDYRATFALRETNGNVVATATVNVGTDGSGVATFGTKGGGKFIPKENTKYTVIETAYGTIDGYDFVKMTDDNGHEIAAATGQTINIGNTKTGAITFVNVYDKQPEASYSLTITKAIDGKLADPNQTFIFKVTSDEDQAFHLTVTVQGAGEVKITGLKAGTYTVTEDQNWSWRYEAEKNGIGTVTLNKENPDGTVTITNNLQRNNWLSGSSFAVNRFENDKVTQTSASN